jgi:hypothetical protein
MADVRMHMYVHMHVCTYSFDFPMCTYVHRAFVGNCTHCESFWVWAGYGVRRSNRLDEVCMYVRTYVAYCQTMQCIRQFRVIIGRVATRFGMTYIRKLHGEVTRCTRTNIVQSIGSVAVACRAKGCTLGESNCVVWSRLGGSVRHISYVRTYMTARKLIACNVAPSSVHRVS